MYHSKGGKGDPPPRSVERFFGVRKNKNLKLHSSDASSSPGNHITHPYSGVPGADGTTARGRRARAGVIWAHFGRFWSILEHYGARSENATPPPGT